MKRLLLLFTAAVFWVGCSKSTTTPIIGNKNIIKVEGYLTPYKFGLISKKDRIIWESKEFNSQGELILKKWRPNMRFDDAIVQNPIKSESYTLENGRVSEMKEGPYSGNRFVYNYNDDNLIEVKEYTFSGIYRIEEFEYNNGLASKSTVYYGNKESISRIDLLTHDGRKNLVNIFRSYSSATSSDANIIYEYDSRNNLIKESYNDINKGTTTIQRIYAYEYDNNGRISEYTHPGPYMFEFFKDVITYDEDGNIGSKLIYRADKLDGKYEEYATVDYEYTYN